MALTQMQCPHALGEALAWRTREISWDMPATELRHLSGRIGERYAALVIKVQLAPQVNQRGYELVSIDGKTISVKTTASPSLEHQFRFSLYGMPSTLKKICFASLNSLGAWR